MVLTIEDESVLAQQNMQTLAKWWKTLNIYEWPEGMPNPEPYVHPCTENHRRTEIMDWIKEMIGERAISREWNSEMTEEEFNDFWRGIHEHHEPSRERYMRRLREQVQADAQKSQA